MAQSKDEMSFLEHLEELRWHLIRSLAAILFFAIGGFLFKDFVFDTLIFWGLLKIVFGRIVFFVTTPVCCAKVRGS